MDPRNFDALAKSLSRSLSRRSVVGGSVAAWLLTTAALVDDALAKNRKNRVNRNRGAKKHDKDKDKKNTNTGHDTKGKGGGGKGKNDSGKNDKDKRDGGGQAGKEACIPTGKKCPSSKPRGKGKDKKKSLGCHQCCQGTFIISGGKKHCACKPTGTGCGGPFQCCSGRCEGGACIPTVASLPPPPGCGDDSEACCEGGVCGAGLVCGQGNVCVACGDGGERCCAGGACADDLVCNLDTVTCVACGDAGELCCAASTCDSDLVCNPDTGRCAPCGGNTELCCTNATCDAGFACDQTNGTCTVCGDDGELCCAGSTCDAGLICSGTTCTPCGGEGQLCCAESTCNGDLACDPGSGTCEATCIALGEACSSSSGLPCCTDVNPNAECASFPQTCQDCNQAPTAEGSLCQNPPNERCCGGSSSCVSAVREEDSEPVCIQFGQCFFPCTTDTDCSSDPQGEPDWICIRTTCCLSQTPQPTAVCATPCPTG